MVIERGRRSCALRRRAYKRHEARVKAAVVGAVIDQHTVDLSLSPLRQLLGRRRFQTALELEASRILRDNSPEHLTRASKALHISGRKAAARERRRQLELGRQQGVYVIGAPGRPLKIGITKNLRARLSDLQCSSADKLEVYFFGEATGKLLPHEVEKRFHKHFAAQRLEGEWFKLDPDEAVAGVLYYISIV